MRLTRQTMNESQDEKTDGVADDPEGKPYVLHLYIAGVTPNSIRAVKNTREICEQHLQGRYELVVVDIYQQPDLSLADQIIAVPTLVKKHPWPLRRLVGDMSNKQRVLAGLGLA